MPVSPLDPHRVRPVDLQARLAADRDGVPYLLYRDGDDEQVLRPLDPGVDRLVLGRSPNVDLHMGWDRSVSRTHAELERIGDEWVIADDGLSANGTHVNGRRLAGRRRLEHADKILAGSTLIVFQAPPAELVDGLELLSTLPLAPPPELTAAQRRVLAELCRPYVLDGRAYTASNPVIAARLCLAEVTVRAHLRTLHAVFGVGPLPQNQKRAELMHRALATGTIGIGDYEDD